MIELSLEQICAAVSGKLLSSDPSQLISGTVRTDSRLVESGDIFIAKVGEFDDGHKYLPGIQGLVALAIVQRPNEDLNVAQIVVPDSVQALADLAQYVLVKVREIGSIQVIGITGSNGKTSTKSVLAKILSHFGETVAPQESFNNQVGLPLTVCRISYGTKYLILELGANGLGSIARLAKIAPPDYGVELKVGLAHAGKFGGIEVTAQIKSELVPFISKLCLLNGDDPNVTPMALLANCPVASFGYAADNDYQIVDSSVEMSGTAFELAYPDGEFARIKLGVLGEHQVYNVCAALAVADALGLDRTLSQQVVTQIDFVERWRMQPMPGPRGSLIINDAYNASPDSMEAALKTLAVLGRQGSQTIAVLGEMAELGDIRVEQHDRIGRLVVRYNIDQLYVIGISAKLIHLGAMQEGSWDGETLFFETRSDALAHLLPKLGKDVVVLVKSSNAAGLRHFGDELAASS